MEQWELQNIASKFKFGDNIYVENVRSILNISNSEARTICQELVEANLFEAVYGLQCPNKHCKRIIVEYKNIHAVLPKEINCDICEMNEEDKSTFKTDDMDVIDYYKLKAII